MTKSVIAGSEDQHSTGRVMSALKQKRKLFAGILTVLGMCVFVLEIYGGDYVKTARELDNSQTSDVPIHPPSELDPQPTSKSVLVDDPLNDHVTTLIPGTAVADPEPGITWVLLLSYQRSGSTFIGGIFNDPHEAFYVYEPLDPLYCAMYGIEDGWAIPSDIFSDKDGQLREIPAHELEASDWVLNKIYTCEMSSLPPAMLAHAFWEMFDFTMTHTSGYIRCLEAAGIDPTTGHVKCQRYLKDFCGFRYRQKERNQLQCKEYLWGDEPLNSSEPRCSKNRRVLEGDLPLHFQRYYSCLAKMDPVLTRCAAQHFDAPCRASSLRAIKTVRGNMQIADTLLQQHDNLYLIHLFRDPRGAVRSRIQATWSQGFYSQGSFAKEATLYCTQVLADVHLRKGMEKTSVAQRIRQHIYDGFSQEPLLNLLDLYHFFGKDASKTIKDTYIANRKEPRNKNSESISTRWKKALSADEIDAVNRHCSELLAEIDFNWT